MKMDVERRLDLEFGKPSRVTKKIKAWDISGTLGAVLQIDQPTRENAAYLWLPHPGDGQNLPAIALEYPGESGRHSNTYASPGLGRGEPALKLVIRDPAELDDVVEYIRAMKGSTILPNVNIRYSSGLTSASPMSRGRNASSANELRVGEPIDPVEMPSFEPVKPRREAIPRSVQREVWQRDGGECVQCRARAHLCFDHIVPFSLGGSNTIRNIQLLCEGCNLSKSNRL
jgi:hypothetical protein